MKKTIWIIRHGETKLNALNIVQGQKMNEPLNDKGRQQALQFWAKYRHEPFDLVLYSNLIRSQQTVLPFLTAGVQATELEDLKEINWGINEGQPSCQEVTMRFSVLTDHWINGNLDARIENGESANELLARALCCVDYFQSVQRKKILVCSHGRTIRALVCLLLKRPLTDMEEFHHSNLGLYKFDFDGYEWQCTHSNDTSHLIL